jgi:hypothetical protein
MCPTNILSARYLSSKVFVPPQIRNGPVFKTSAPVLNPIPLPPPVDLLADDPLPTDPIMEMKADEDLISFDQCYQTYIAEEILNAPLTMKTEDVKAKAISKAKAFLAKKEEDLKSETISVGTVDAPKPAKPEVPPVAEPAKVANPAEFPPLASQQMQNAKSKDPKVMNNPVAAATSGNAWAAKKDRFPNEAAVAPVVTAPSAVASPAVAPSVQLMKSMALSEPEGTKYAAHDPTDPNFDISKYYVPFLGKYKCPYHPKCM